MDSGAIPNFIPKTLGDILPLTPEESNKRIRTAICVKSPANGILKDVPISCDHVVELIDFLVIEGSPSEMVIGRSTMRKLNGVLTCGKQCFSREKDGEQVAIQLVTNTFAMIAR